MAVSLLHLLVTTTAVACIAKAVKECPPWFEWVNTSDSSGYCACPSQVPDFIHCDERNQRTSISQGSCIFYNPKEDITRGSGCSFFFPAHATKNGMFTLPANVSELNNVVCGNLSREVKGPLCGRCTNGTGPSVYSIGIECVSCSPINIFYYLLLQYLPSTGMFLIVIIFRPNITSGPMANYVLFCNFSVIYFRLNLRLFVKPHNVATNLAKTALTLSAVWSFDTLLFISPHLCISHHMEEFYTPLLEFVATVYPFVLLLLTYAVIEMHRKNFVPVVYLWRWFSRVYVQFYRAWDPRSSMIQAFASLFYLSYARLSYLIWQAFEWSDVRHKEGNEHRLLYIDPNVPYGSNKHVLLMTFSVAVAVFVFLPPVLILVVYPTSLYRKISHWISPKWRLRIKTYVETFNGCLKDGTNGTRDYRSLCGWGLLLSCPFLGLLISIIAIIYGPPNETFIATYTTAIFLCVIAFFCIWQQPYKDRNSNTLTGGLLVLVSLLATGTVHSPESENNAKVFMIILLLVPHIVLWSYVIWRVLKTITSHCYRCQNEANREREGLLHHCSEQMN